MLKLKVVCVGEGMAFVMERLEKKYSNCVSFILIDTDAKALMSRNVSNKMLIGIKSLCGLGSYGNANVVEKSIGDNEKELQDIFKGTDVVLLISALGCGTGSGASPEIARIAKNSGTKILSFVSKPIKHEGPLCKERAELAINKLSKISDLCLVLENDEIEYLENKGFNVANMSLNRRLNRVYYVIASKIIRMTLEHNLLMSYHTADPIVLILWLSKYIERLVSLKSRRVQGITMKNFKLHKISLDKWPSDEMKKRIPPWLVVK